MSPVSVSFQFGYGSNIARVQLRHRNRGLALHDGNMRQLLLRAAAEVHHRGIIFQDAGENFEIGNPPREGIGNRLEYIKRYRLRIGFVPPRRLSVARRGRIPLHPLVLRRRRRVVHDEIHHPVGADIAQARAENYRENLVLANGVVQRRDQVFLRDGSLFEELFQQRVVALGHQFHQLFVLGLGLVFHVGGNLGFFPLAVAAQFVGVGLHGDQIDHAAKVFLFPNGQFQRDHRTPEGVGQRFQHTLRIGALAIHAAGHNQPRRLIFLAVVPHPLGHHFHAGDAVHDHDRRIHHRQHQLGLVDKHVEPGRIHDIDFRFAPLHVRQAGGN